MRILYFDSQDKSKSDEEPKHFSFRNELTVAQCKAEICEAFGINGEQAIGAHALYRLDGFGQPSFAIKKEKATFSKSHVANGDVLALMSKTDSRVNEVLSLKIHLTYTGLPDDCRYIGEVQASPEYTLEDLKQLVLTLPEFEGRG